MKPPAKKSKSSPKKKGDEKKVRRTKGILRGE